MIVFVSNIQCVTQVKMEVPFLILLGSLPYPNPQQFVPPWILNAIHDTYYLAHNKKSIHDILDLDLTSLPW